MQNSTAPQNPIDAKFGRAINENPHVTFHPITDSDKQNAQNNLQLLIEHTRRAIDPLNDLED